jgi:hypothetical protein
LRTAFAKTDAFRAASGALARAGYVDRALVTARELPDPRMQAAVFVGVAEGLLSSGSTSQAFSLINRARDLAAGLTDEYWTKRILFQVVLSLTTTGHADRALVIARRATPETACDLLSIMAEETERARLTADGEALTEELLRTARRIVNDRERAGALASVAVRFALIGRYGQATEIVEQLLATPLEPVGWHSFDAVSAGAIRVLALAGHPDRALALLDGDISSLSAESLVEEVIENLVRLGRTDDALEFCAQSRMRTARSLGAIARSFAEAGRPEDATGTARQAIEVARSAGRAGFFRAWPILYPLIVEIDDDIGAEALARAALETESWLTSARSTAH